jgi:hypothetical protein
MKNEYRVETTKQGGWQDVRFAIRVWEGDKLVSFQDGIKPWNVTKIRNRICEELSETADKVTANPIPEVA